MPRTVQDPVYTAPRAALIAARTGRGVLAVAAREMRSPVALLLCLGARCAMAQDCGGDPCCECESAACSDPNDWECDPVEVCADACGYTPPAGDPPMEDGRAVAEVLRSDCTGRVLLMPGTPFQVTSRLRPMESVLEATVLKGTVSGRAPHMVVGALSIAVRMARCRAFLRVARHTPPPAAAAAATMAMAATTESTRAATVLRVSIQTRKQKRAGRLERKAELKRRPMIAANCYSEEPQIQRKTFSVRGVGGLVRKKSRKRGCVVAVGSGVAWSQVEA